MKRVNSIEDREFKATSQSGKNGAVVAYSNSQGARAFENNTRVTERSITERNVESPGTKVVVANLYDLLASVSDVYLGKPHFCKQGKIKVVIETLDELNDFIKLLEKQPRAEFIKRIAELDFGNLGLESTSVTGPITITLPESLKDITKLFVGGVGYKVTVNLPRKLDNLEELHIGNIRNVIRMPVDLPCLKKLCIVGTDTDSEFELPCYLDNLEELILGTILVPFDLPRRLDKLKILEIRSNVNNFDMSMVGNSLVSLIIKGYSNKIIFPNAIPNLQILEIGDGYGDFHIQLPKSIPTLVSLKIGEVYSDAPLTLPESLANLESFEIESKDGNEGKVILSKSYCKLENLIINKQKAKLQDVNGHKEFFLECDSSSSIKFLQEINRRINVTNTEEEGSSEQESESDSSEGNADGGTKKRNCSIQ